MTQQTKDEARDESLRRWRALPPNDRQTTEQAQVFAAALAGMLDFRTMGNKRMVIVGWLLRDLDGLPPWGNLPPESHSQAASRPLADAASASAAPDEAAAAKVSNDNAGGDEDQISHAAE